MRAHARAPAARAAALVLAFAMIACAGEEAARPGAVPPVTAAPPRVWARADAPEASTSKNVDDARIPEADAAALLRPAIPEPSFGSESPKPRDAHPFKLAVALRATRAAPSGAKVLKMLSLLPAVIGAKVQTAVDPFADGEWLLVYGSTVAVPGPNANVVKHGRAEAEVTRTIADAGFAAADGAAGPKADLFAVRDVLLRPQPGVMALVPGDRARELAAELAKPIDPGIKPGELARIFVGQPAKYVRFLPAEVVNATVLVTPASDGGLDLRADADCPDVAACKAIATSLDELVKRQNSLVVRIVLKNVLASFTARGDGAKLRATLHAAPDQVDAALNIARAQLGLPGADAGDAGP